MKDDQKNRNQSLQLKEREIKVREKELELRKKELEFYEAGKQSHSTPIIYDSKNAEISPQKQQLESTQPTESLAVFMSRLLKNSCYASGSIMLATTLSAIFTANPTPTLIGASFMLIFALFLVGVFFHLILWSEGKN